ncbi:hypothetical protein Tco_0316157 [Tanacetum coccineum]
MISNEYAVKLCLEHEVKRGNKVVKKELIIALRETEEEGKRNDDWDHFLDFNIDDIPLLGEEGLLPLVCKMGKNKVELDGKTVKEEEEAVKRIKGEALKKEDPRDFIFPIRLEGQVNKNALADMGSDINTMPFRIYVQLGRDDMKKVDRGIMMINHTQAEAMGMLTNTFDGFCHQTFRAARSDFMRNTESDSDDEEEYQIKRNKFGAPIYGPKPAPYLNCNDPDERSLAIQIVTNPFWKISVWKKAVSFLGSLPVPLKQVNWKHDYKGSYTKEE